MARAGELPGQIVLALHPGWCCDCGLPIGGGDLIVLDAVHNAYVHAECPC